MPDVVGTTNYPTSLDTAVSLIESNNNAVTALDGGIDDSEVTVTVISTDAFPDSGVISIDSEIISYTGKTSTTFTGCIRGFDDSTPATHADEASVEGRLVSKHLKVLQDAIIATQTKLNSTASGAVSGPGSSTDNAVARFDSTTGKVIQNSPTTVNDAGAITMPEMTAPSTPASGHVVIYPKSDGKVYRKDDTGTENELGGGDASTLNGQAGSYYTNRSNHTGTQALSTISGITATTTELNYTDGVTSNIQTQLNAKASTTHKSTHVSGGGDAFATTDVLDAAVKRLRDTDGNTLLVASWPLGTFLCRTSTGNISGVNPNPQISASVKASGTQSIASATNVAVSFNTEEWDTNAMWSNSDPTRIYVPAGYGGKYLVTGQVAFDNNSTGHRSLKICVNGNTGTWLAKTNETNLGTTDCQWLQVTKVFGLSAGDYVELIAYQNSGSALNIGLGVDEGGVDEASWFQIIRIA